MRFSNLENANKKLAPKFFFTSGINRHPDPTLTSPGLFLVFVEGKTKNAALEKPNLTRPPVAVAVVNRISDQIRKWRQRDGTVLL